MDAASDLLSGKLSEPAFDLIDPRRRCWREMRVVMRPSRQPSFDGCSFVGGVIVHDNVDIEALWNLRVDLLKKIEELGGSVALVAFADHKSGRNVEGRKKRCCAVADIGMGPAFWNAGHHR